MKYLIDTNIIVRFLMGDHQDHFEEAKKYFNEAEKGKKKLIIKPLVIAEVCFVLESFYKKEREEISDALEVLLSQKWLIVEERDVLLALWPLYKKNFHFVDTLLLATAQINQVQLLSFDQKLVKESKK